MRWWLGAATMLVAACACAQPKRILYLTHSAGFVHSSLTESAAALQTIAARSGDRLNVTHTEDVSLLRADVLAGYDAVFFFTSGELPISAAQKSDLLDFVRRGKGFGGAHSATDTFYQWPEYLDLIGARFNGHPWVQEAAVEIEDPQHPASRPVSPSFRLLEEYYQFRDFSRARSRVLMTIDVRTIDLSHPDANKGTRDFPVAWAHPFGDGRVFYTALGHFESTWKDERFRSVLLEALLWLTGQIPGDATPRPIRAPELTPEGVANAATLTPAGVVAPGGFISIFGNNLTTGSESSSTGSDRLAGTEVTIDGIALPLVYVSSKQINALVPTDFAFERTRPILEIRLPATAAAVELSQVEATPGIFGTLKQSGVLTVFATGLGRRPGAVTARINGQPASISALAAALPGLYHLQLPTNASNGRVEIEVAGAVAAATF